MAAPKRSPSLAALMSAAAALAPAAHAQDAAEGSSTVGYRFNEYGEDSFEGAAIGSRDRYKVYAQQVQLDTRLPNNAGLDVTATHEVMSGSSPWYVLPDANNRPVQVLSGATIREHRSELRAAYTVDPGTAGFEFVEAKRDDKRALIIREGQHEYVFTEGM